LWLGGGGVEVDKVETGAFNFLVFRVVVQTLAQKFNDIRA